jgi:isopropylmalate/homocitrate/citramalate synthase
MGVETKIDLEKLAEASRFMEKVLGYSLPSKCLQTIKSVDT